MNIGFFGLLTLILITLKLTGYITLSWLVILAIPFITTVSIFILGAIYVAVRLARRR